MIVIVKEHGRKGITRWVSRGVTVISKNDGDDINGDGDEREKSEKESCSKWREKRL